MERKAFVVDPQTGCGPEGWGANPLGVPKSREFNEFPRLCSCLCTFCGILFLQLQFDPSRDPNQSLERLGLESTGEETAHRVRRLLLHRGGHVGVGVQGEAGRLVSQHGGEGFHVHAAL